LRGEIGGRLASILIACLALSGPVAFADDQPAGRFAGQIQATRQALNTVRAASVTIGAKEQVEAQIAKLTAGLDKVESAPANTDADRTARLLELARLSTAAQQLAGSIQVINGGRRLVFSGPLVEASWLSHVDQVPTFAVFVLSDTSLGDEIFQPLAPAKNLEALLLDSARKITGRGLGQLTSEKLRRINLSNTGVNDDALKDLRKFPTIEEFDLDGTGLTGAVFAQFEGLPKLKYLSLAGTQVADEGFAAVGKLASLESLFLKGTKIHGPSLRNLEGLTKLKTLDLGHTQIEDGDLSALAKLTQLESLSLEDTPVTGAGFDQLKGLNKFAALNLNRTRVGDSAMRQFGVQPKLQRLEASSTRVTDGGLSQLLEPAAGLQYLDLYGTNVTDATLALLKNKQGLDNLFLGGTQVTDAGVANLQNLPNLEHLDLGGTQVTDAGLLTLQGKKLFDLRLKKTGITGAGLMAFANIRMLFMDLSDTGVTDENLAAFAKLDHLQTLDLSGTPVTSKGMSKLQNCGSLNELRLAATAVGDEGLEQLGSFKYLQNLDLNETAVTDAGLKHLRKFGKLTALSLSGTSITDAGLPELADKYVELDLSRTRITNQGVAHLQGINQLSKLRLASTAITNDALKLLQVLTGLTRLDLADTAVDDQGLAYLALLPRLQELNLNGTTVSDRGLDALLKLPSLRRVSLEGARITAQGATFLRRHAPNLTVDLVFPFVWGESLSYYDLSEPAKAAAPPLKELQGLRSLRLNDALLTPEILRSLRYLPTPEDLSFARTSVTDDELLDLPGLPQIERLDCSDTRLTDRLLTHLEKMPALREVNLQGTQVTGSGLVHLAGLPRLQALNLARTPLDDAGAAHLAELKELRKLELGNTRVTGAGIEHLANLPRLQYLDLYGTAITDRGAASLSRLTALRFLYLTNTKLTDAGLDHLRELTELEELGLDGTPVTDHGLDRLAPLTNLVRLRLGRTQVTNAGLEVLRGMTGLKSLDLSNTKIDDGALTALAGLSSLAELNVRDTGVTDEALARFRQAHPAISVITGKTPTGYAPWALVIAILYVIAVGLICFYGLHRCWLTWRLLRDPETRKSPAAAGHFSEMPRVTVQLPMFNERHVAERIIEAVCALDYPRDRLQIQVLDDSNDDSAEMARRCCELMVAAGHPVEYLHRSTRAGFKSGALAAGLKTATGEFIVIFDADFIPAPDFLRQTIHYFTDAKVGMVQTEWSHLNRGESWLTELQAMFLDGHCVVEQAVRSRSRRWFNFNGTAGVWRRSCIDEAGGWQHDTLTEDTDLSYRAQLAGWRFLYLPTVRCNAELPSSMTAFLTQQHRWTKGLIQTAKKLLPRILVSQAPWKIKLEACYHLTTPVMYLVMFLVAAVALPAMFLATPFTDQSGLALAAGFGTLLLGTFGAATFYVVSQRVQGFPLGRTLLKIPLLMALGIGICAVNGRAVLEALLGLKSPFVRTPKLGESGDIHPDHLHPRPRLHFPGGLLELLMAGVLFACLVLSFLRPFTLIGAPFLLLFALGYTGVGLLRLLDRFATHPAHLRSAATPWQRLSTARFAMGTVGALVLAGVALATVRLASPPPAAPPTRGAVALGLDLPAARWQVQASGKSSAIKSIQADRGALVLGVQLDDQANEGEIYLDLEGAMPALGDSLGRGRQLTFTVEHSPRFTGELQAFVKDGKGRLEYGAMQIVESHDAARPVAVALIPDVRTPAMGYQDKGFDPSAGIRRLGLKISAQSDRVRGAGYRPFRGTVRIASARVTDVERGAHPEPEMRSPEHGQPQPVLPPQEFLAGSGVDRPWPLGYAFSGPVTEAHKQELERTYSTLAAKGCHFTRVYAGDYRTGLLVDRQGQVTGVEPGFLDYFDQLATVANAHGITVMFSLTDNAMVNGGRAESLALLREGAASDAFVDHVLAELVKKLQGRQVIWDIFNEPENVTTLPLREVQRYIDRVLAAGRRADPRARFTVVSRSRPEIACWQGRGLDLYSHNIFTQRALEEALAAPRTLEVPIMVAEMAPAVATAENLDALRQAGYAGVGLWGWGTRDKYEWPERDLERIMRPLAGMKQAQD
jgi:cellulose synthase/poly-beta-1,6-N-acetylglucosamine synthase-like glycosyltransferase/Leucine-rich repeat (LRR) protein